MMDRLIDTLNSEQCNLVVLHDGKMNTFDGVGVRTLYHLQQEEPELLYHSKLAAKAVGRTAAKMMTSCEVDEVYADVISDYAFDTLKDAGVRVSYGSKVDHARFLKLWEEMGEETNRDSPTRPEVAIIRV